MPSFIIALLTLIRSYRATWFSILMLMVAILAGALGLATVLNLSERAGAVSASAPWYQFTDFYRIDTRDKTVALTPDDYRFIKRHLPFPSFAVATTSIELSDTGSVQVIKVDSLAAIQAAPWLSSSMSASTFSQAAFSQQMMVNEQTLAKLKSADHPKLRNILASTTPNISDALENNILITDISIAVTDINDIEFSTFLVAADITQENTQHISGLLPEHLTLQTGQSQFETSRMSESFQLNLLALGLLMFTVCMFIVFNAVNLLLFKRIKTFRILRQLGISRHSILLAQILESVIITLILVLVAAIFSRYFDLYIAGKLSGIVQQNELETHFGIRFIQVSAICILGLFLAMIKPIRDLKSSLANEQDISSTMPLRLLFLISTLVMATAFITLMSASSLIVLLIATSALVLSTSCALISVLPGVIRFVASFSSLSNYRVFLSSKAAVHLAPRLSIACCAFFIAVTCNIGMNLMVDSFRQVTDSWLEQRLIADAYLYNEQSLTEQQMRDLTGLNIDVTPRFEDIQAFNQQRLDVFSYPTTQEYRDALSFDEAQPDAWQHYKAQKGVFINQQMAFEHKVSLGDTLQLQIPKTGVPSDFVVEGIYLDYGNPNAQALMPLNAFDSDINKTEVFALAFKGASDQKVLSQIADLTNADVYSSVQLIALSMQSFDNTFVITNILNFVTLLVAGVALASTILVLVDTMQPHTFLLRSLGFSSAQILSMQFIQYILLVIVALLLATPFGILISWVLINIINVNAFNWAYPMSLSWVVLFKVYLLSIVIVMVTIAIPVFRQSKQSISRELACAD